MGTWSGPPENAMHEGAPRGNQNKNKGKRWSGALRKALTLFENDKVKGGQALDKIALEVVGAAVDRTDDNWQFAVKEIGMRLDGKPTERIEVDASDAAGHVVGISAAFAALIEATGKGEVIDGEVVVSDRPLLSAEVCVEAGGHGEGVDFSEVSGRTE